MVGQVGEFGDLAPDEFEQFARRAGSDEGRVADDGQVVNHRHVLGQFAEGLDDGGEFEVAEVGDDDAVEFAGLEVGLGRMRPTLGLDRVGRRHEATSEEGRGEERASESWGDKRQGGVLRGPNRQEAAGGRR